MPTFDKVPLQTARLLLRPLEPPDAVALLAIHSDEEVMRYSNTPAWASLEQATALIEQGQRGLSTGKHLCLGIVPRDVGAVVGTCTLYDLSEQDRRAEIGFVLGAPAWGHGYMGEALGALAHYSFHELGLNRLEADTDPRNDRSIALLERLGFVREGHLRERWLIGGEKSDTLLYGLLSKDWQRIHGPLPRTSGGAGTARPGHAQVKEQTMPERPSFIRSSQEVAEHAHVYPQSSEPMGPVRRVGKEAGLQRIGVNIQRLPPGSRSSWPHAEENEEEFVYVLEGSVDAWIDGHLHRMQAGDLAAFPAGTGIAHCFINNTDREIVLLVGGEAPKAGSRIFYPLNPSRRSDMDPSNWWDDVPQRALGPHDGLPEATRGKGAA
jgi:RimJ/RimL family protein N-acetyltransferase/uncharacterized cupin superfamily protein